MYSFAKRMGLAAAVGMTVFATAATARAQFQVAPGLNQNPYSAGTAGATGSAPGSNFFSRGTSGSGFNAFNLGPYASMSSTPTTGASSPYLPSPYPYYPPWNPFYGEYYNPANGNLFGASAVIGAEAQYMTSVQQAYLMREQVRREKLENRRRIFEEWLYERNNTPTQQDEFERTQQLNLRRARNDPPINEILSGLALNDLLVDIQKLQGRGIKGPDIPLDDSIVKNINFVPKGKVAANPGLLKRLKSKGQLDWPLALRMPGFEKDRDLLNTLTKDAVQQAGANGQVDVGTLNEMNNAVKRLRDGLRESILKEGLPSNQYGPSANFLTDMESSLRALSDTDAQGFVSGKFAARGGSVGDLVKDMTQKGLQFAPSTPGDEQAYVALHRMLATYDFNGNTLQTADQPPR